MRPRRRWLRGPVKAGEDLTAGGEGLLNEGLMSAEGYDAPIVDNGDAIAKALGLFHVVGRLNILSFLKEGDSYDRG
jgi:hypothetical protein